MRSAQQNREVDDNWNGAVGDNVAELRPFHNSRYAEGHTFGAFNSHSPWVYTARLGEVAWLASKGGDWIYLKLM